MEFLVQLAVLFTIIGGAIRAITPIVTTTIAEKHKTERARLSSGVTNSRNANAANENAEISSCAFMTRRKRGDSIVGLVAVALSTLELAWLQFGPLNSSPMTVGVFSHVASCLLLAGVGWFLLVRR